MTKTVLLADFLTQEEIEKCRDIYRECRGTTAMTTDRIEAEIIKPNIDRINAAIGIQCDERYLAYSCEYVLSLVEAGRDGPQRVRVPSDG